MTYAQVDDLFAEFFVGGTTPGLAFGVVRDGGLVHDGSFGTTSVDRDERPSVDSVFRIASMSKSFTAAALLLLRDRGLVDLDEAVAQYVPELVDQAPYSSESPAVTLRLLLTHGAGLLTDDPWGDRQESLSYDAFGTFLDGGFTPGREPGVGYEYSNLGFALLGRVIENVVGGAGDNRHFVEAELLAPLGMTASRYDADAVGAALVPGHVKRAGEWVEVPATTSGAFSAMGGLHASVADLARWVGGFTEAFRPGADGHPLSKATRREMQQLHRFALVDGSVGVEKGVVALARGYGYGLVVDHHSLVGQRVGHSGGYPGYGSQMVWHPESGLGIVTLSNGTYAGAYDVAHRALDALVLAAGRPARRPVVPSVETTLSAAIERVAAFDTAGEEVFATPDLFAENVAQDIPDAERRRLLDELRASVGAMQSVPERAVLRSIAMAQASVVVPAERGHVVVDLLLSPEATPRIQRLDLTALPAAPEGALARAREVVTGASPDAVLLRALASGEPEVVPTAVAVTATSAEFAVRAGSTWWKAAVPTGSAGEPVVLTALSTTAAERVAWLAAQL